MKIRKYKIKEKEFLVYGNDEDKIPEDIEEIKFVKDVEDIEEESSLPIYAFVDFMLLFVPMKTKLKRTRDKVLGEIGISSWDDLKQAYFSMASFSRREREYIIEKYSEIVNEL